MSASPEASWWSGILASGPGYLALLCCSRTVATSDVPRDGSRVHTHDHDGSEAPDVLPDSILSIELSPTSYREPKVDKHNLLQGGCSDSRISSLRSIGGGMYRDCGSGGSEGDDDGSNGDECAGGAVHLARRSPAEGGDSEIGGDGDGVVMARSLSTSASGGRDMEVYGQTVILAPIVMSVEGGGITSSVPSGGKTGSSTGAKLEKDVSELKIIDHSTEALSTLRSQVLTVVKHYLGSKISDDL
ncbi:hypothetical protein Tco_0289817 [Tanacetum coccineum]